jgi:hypothetical protein
MQKVSWICDIGGDGRGKVASYLRKMKEPPLWFLWRDPRYH